MKQAEVVILLSTFNGERYLNAQIESIRAQTFQSWLLFIRDDGSRDETISIIKKFAAIDKRIIFFEDSLGNVRTSQSFSLLLGHFLRETTAPYVFFADQDDVWLPHKLALQIECFKRVSVEKPLLVFSDLQVVNADLESIHPSFLRFEHYHHQIKNPLNTLLIHNFITGCAMGMSRALVEKVYPIPDHAIMHDWWCGLVAATIGQIDFVNEATVLYRQHGQNAIGSLGHVNKLKRILSGWRNFSNHYRDRKKLLVKRILQARDLYSRIDSSNPYSSMLSVFCSLLTQPVIQRMHALLQLQLRPLGWMRKIYFFILVLSTSS